MMKIPPRSSRAPGFIVLADWFVFTHKIPGVAYRDHRFDVIKNHLRDKALGRSGRVCPDTFH